MLYAINNIYGAIQGEGINTGVPMVIVRLQGCSVGCVWCDQKETWAQDYSQQQTTLRVVKDAPKMWAWADENEIRDYVSTHYPGYNWILITGGEPAEQDLQPMVCVFHNQGKRVALETSGTALGHIGAGLDWICVSPKLGKEIHHQAVDVADELKFIVCREADLNTISRFLLEYWRDRPKDRICLQPVSQSPAATKLAVEWCQLNNWRLSVQTHKYIGIE